jgi:hypothetical protein
MVCFKMKPELTEEERESFFGALADLPRAISLAQNWHDGRNLSPRDQTYDHGLVCDFADWKAFQDYIDHPAHQAFLRNYLNVMVANRVVIDFEF